MAAKSAAPSSPSPSKAAPGKGPNAEFILPVLIFGVPEAHRAARELEALETYFRERDIRGAIMNSPVPKTSRALEALAAENNCDLIKPEHRTLLLAFLKGVLESAPRVHISFASDPSAAFSAKIVTWFRRQTSPIVLVQVGLQPGIAAGCILRTPNKAFDFSLRHRFDARRSLLVASIRQQASEAAPQARTTAAGAQPAPTAQGAAQ